MTTTEQTKTRNSNFRLVADQVYCALDLTELASKDVNKALKKVKEWAEAQGLITNLRKIDSWKEILENAQFLQSADPLAEVDAVEMTLSEISEIKEIKELSLTEIKAELKKYKEEGKTEVKLNSTKEVLRDELSRLTELEIVIAK